MRKITLSNGKELTIHPLTIGQVRTLFDGSIQPINQGFQMIDWEGIPSDAVNDLPYSELQMITNEIFSETFASETETKNLQPSGSGTPETERGSAKAANKPE